MALLTVTVPDGLVPRLAAALQSRYPELSGTQAQIGRAGVRLLLRETLAAAEGAAAARNGETAMVNAVQTARAQALADGDTITA